MIWSSHYEDFRGREHPERNRSRIASVGANEDIRVAVVDFRGQGGLHLQLLRELAGVRAVAVCDVDQSVLDRELARSAGKGEKLATYTDVRRLLEDKNIDAITTATPDHWHALITIWACQTGKDVYVEKPISHNLWEGRKMVEAARKYNRIVQYGNHNHGHHTGEMRTEIDQVGKIQVVWSALDRKRESIGKVSGPQPVPSSLNYDLWLGPAPQPELMRKQLHYEWHWDWSTGTGELGKYGIYPLNEVRLALGQNTLPTRTRKRIDCCGAVTGILLLSRSKSDEDIPSQAGRQPCDSRKQPAGLSELRHDDQPQRPCADA